MPGLWVRLPPLALLVPDRYPAFRIPAAELDLFDDQVHERSLFFRSPGEAEYPLGANARPGEIGNTTGDSRRNR